MSGRLSKLPWIEIGILVLAAVLRLVLLDIKPAHFDEGVNGWFADQMTRLGHFRYDPNNYHGPLHFYAVFLSQTLFGRNLWALRLPAIISSLLAIWAILRYREFFGSTAARIAAIAMAVSPAYVFYGRYSIHESWQVFFLASLLWGLLGLWEKGERRFLYTVVWAFTGMILIKETYVVHAGCFLLAALTLWLWQMVVPSRPALAITRQQWTWRDTAMPLGLAVLAIVFFYSGNFQDFSLLRGLYQTYAAWFHTGVEAAGHEKHTYDIFGIPQLNYYWIALMAKFEWAGLLGFVLSVGYAGKTDARLRYIAIYGGGALLAYSIIPYKTPWCIIAILWPFYLVLGATIAPFFQQWKQAVIAGCTVLFGISLGQTIWLNFYHYTDEDVPYVYVQTFPEIRILTDPLVEMAEKDPRYYSTRGQIILDSYYPLPWMLGGFHQIGYYKISEPPNTDDTDFVAVETKDAATIEAGLQGRFYKRDFRMRGSQGECVVYFREEPFKEWFKDAQPNFVKP